MKKILVIQNLRVHIGAKDIVRGLSLSLSPGELHVLMGPNGSGKSTIAAALLGHPHYKVSATKLAFNGKDIRKLKTDARARLGMFLGFQYPLTVAGVSLANVLSETIRVKRKETKQIHLLLASKMAVEQQDARNALQQHIASKLKELELPEAFLYRGLNDGFSGGEKKKAEILQMRALKPKLAILDEPDSGVDVDALRSIAQSIRKAQSEGTAVLLITHYQRILKYLRPDRVHVLINGKITASGSSELARQIEKKGYQSLR